MVFQVLRTFAKRFIFACDNILTNIYPVSVLRRAYAFLRRSVKQPIMLKMGNGLIVGPSDSFALLLSFCKGYYEKLTTTVFKMLLKRQDVVIDVGAGFGYYTLIASKIVGPEGKVFAFEPEPIHYVFLLLNIKLNNINNVCVLNYAVANFNGISKLYIAEEESSLLRTYKGRNVILVRVVRLDDIIPYNISVSLVKMDIEGAEPLALEGMYEIAKRSKDLKLIIEVNPEALQHLGFKPREIIYRLQELGFTKFIIIDEVREKIRPLNNTMLLDELRYTVNMLCLK